MMSRRLTGAVRAFGLVGLVLALAACASTPAPISTGGSRVWERPAEAAPYRPDLPPRISNASARLQCVPFARDLSGIQIFGDANTWWGQAEGRYPRSSSPAPGSVLVMRGFSGPGRGHVAVVTEIISDRLIRVNHANWLNTGEISVDVPVMDVSPNNDWSELRVWHIPGNHWGGRIYQAQGFIHAFSLHAAVDR